MGWTARARFLEGTRDYSALHSAHTGSGAHSASYKMDTVGSFSKGKGASAWSWTFTSIWSYISSPPYAFMTWYLVKNFYFASRSESAKWTLWLEWPWRCVYAISLRGVEWERESSVSVSLARWTGSRYWSSSEVMQVARVASSYCGARAQARPATTCPSFWLPQSYTLNYQIFKPRCSLPLYKRFVACYLLYKT
jgi:hypothetical protein